MIFGMNESVTSLICVAAWKTETSSPTTSPATRNGPETLSVSVMAWMARWVTVSWFTGSSASGVEGSDEGLRHQVPAIHQHEQEDLERQGDEDRRQHHHPHGHERRRDDHVDDQEGQVDQEADLEGGLQLRDHEGGDQHVGRHVGAGLRPLLVRE